MATSSIQKPNDLLTIGDFNAHISENSKIRFTYHNSRNRNGKLVIDYDEEDANMLLTNTHTSIYANITASYDYFIKANEGE